MLRGIKRCKVSNTIRFVRVTVTVVQTNWFNKVIRIIRRQSKSCTNINPLKTSIIRHFSMLEVLCWLLLLTWCAGKSGFSRLQIVLATTLLAPRSSLPSVIPCSFHRVVLSPGPVAFWLRGSNDLPQTYGVQKVRSTKKSPTLRYHPNTPPPRSNARRPPRNGRSCRLLKHPPGSNTRVCLDFVSMTFLQ